MKATKKRFIDEVIGKVKMNVADKFVRIVDDCINVTDMQLDEILSENHSILVSRRDMKERKRVFSEAFENIKYF